MNNDTQAISEITAAVADSDRPLTSFGLEMMKYELLLRRLAESHPKFPALKGMNSPSVTATGHAIDPWRASLSLVDRTRTAAFIRGGVRAVERGLTDNPDRPTYVIEAGCGPLAPLSIPLMARFGPEQLQVILVDLHQESIDCACHIIDKLELSDRICQAICGDLMNLKFSENADVIILETMCTALFREPQVALTRSLVRAFPNAILLPETITIDLQIFDLGKEAGQMPPVPGPRQLLGQVFRLDRSTALDAAAEDGRLEAATIRLPDTVESGENLFLTTSVSVCDEVAFADYDAEITLPVGLAAEPDWLGNDLHFSYRMTEPPGFEWALKS